MTWAGDGAVVHVIVRIVSVPKTSLLAGAQVLFPSSELDPK
jgi:hypothetical protein